MVITTVVPYGTAIASLSGLEKWHESLASTDLRERWMCILLADGTAIAGTVVVLPGRMDEARLQRWASAQTTAGRAENRRKTLELMRQMGMEA